MWGNAQTAGEDLADDMPMTLCENQLVALARKHFVQYDLMAGTRVPT